MGEGAIANFLLKLLGQAIRGLFALPQNEAADEETAGEDEGCEGQGEPPGHGDAPFGGGWFAAIGVEGGDGLSLFRLGGRSH